MIHLHRTATIANGKMREAVGWSLQVAEYAKSVMGIPVEVVMPLGGNFFDIGWKVQYESMDAVEKSLTKLNADPQYLDLLQRAEGLFVPGSAREELWRSLG